jgi:hypothetical protein
MSSNANHLSEKQPGTAGTAAVVDHIGLTHDPYRVTIMRLARRNETYEIRWRENIRHDDGTITRERRSEPGDKRVKRVYLTPEAERVHKRIWRIAEDTVETALADLTARESQQLFALLQRVKETLVSGTNGSAKASATAAGRNAASRGMRRPTGRIPS